MMNYCDQCNYRVTDENGHKICEVGLINLQDAKVCKESFRDMPVRKKLMDLIDRILQLYEFNDLDSVESELRTLNDIVDEEVKI